MTLCLPITTPLDRAISIEKKYSKIKLLKCLFSDIKNTFWNNLVWNPIMLKVNVKVNVTPINPINERLCYFREIDKHQANT